MKIHHAAASMTKATHRCPSPRVILPLFPPEQDSRVGPDWAVAFHLERRRSTHPLLIISTKLRERGIFSNKME